MVTTYTHTLPKHLIQLAAYQNSIPRILYPKRNRWILFSSATISIDPNTPLEDHIMRTIVTCTVCVLVHVPQIVNKVKWHKARILL